MNIYLVHRIGKTGYDEYSGFVVTAKSEGGARELCMNEDGIDKNIWFNPKYSTCELIGKAVSKKSELILRSFRAA